jgi:HSP20 family protein
MLALFNQFDDLFGDELRTRRAQRTFVPAVDIEERKEDYRLTADLPGLTADDVEVTIENGVLTVSGERKDERVEEKNGYRRVERHFGSFRRAFTLPKGISPDRVSAHTENGQLEVIIPKPAEEAPRKVKVGSK